MPLLNYTTRIPTERTLGEMQRLLAKHGARSVQVDYDAHGEPCALAFVIATQFGERAFRLPARIAGVEAVLARDWNNARAHAKRPDHAQAMRVGWRILQDWLEAQIALIQTEMITLVEVMLPFMEALPDGTTVYQLMERRQLALPPPASQ